VLQESSTKLDSVSALGPAMSLLFIKIAAFAALGGFLFGCAVCSAASLRSCTHPIRTSPTSARYDLGLIGGALLGITEELGLSTFSQEAIVGSAKLGAVFGTFFGGCCMLRYGRRQAIAYNSLFFTLGPIVMAASSSVGYVALASGPPAPGTNPLACPVRDVVTSMWSPAVHPPTRLVMRGRGLVVGRIITGFGIGSSAVAIPVYLAEVAPAATRGAVVQVYEVRARAHPAPMPLINSSHFIKCDFTTAVVPQAITDLQSQPLAMDNGQQRAANTPSCIHHVNLLQPLRVLRVTPGTRISRVRMWGPPATQLQHHAVLRLQLTPQRQAGHGTEWTKEAQ
jgi:hypothetical protein